MTCAQLRTNIRTSICRKICHIKLEFQNLYAAEQFIVHYFQKINLKQGAQNDVVKKNG